jgi:hypothetical protein
VQDSSIGIFAVVDDVFIGYHGVISGGLSQCFSYRCIPFNDWNGILFYILRYSTGALGATIKVFPV